MERPWRRVPSIALTVMLVVGLASPASALISRRYRGETSQDLRIAAKVVSREGRASLTTLGLDVRLTCEDATELEWGFRIWWGGGVRLGADHIVEWDDAGFGGSEAFSFRGRFWPGHARGSLRYTIATLTAEEEAMVCTTGDLTWEMQRITEPTVAARGGASLDGVTKVRVSADGDVVATTREL